MTFMGERRGTYRIFEGKSEGKSPFGSRRFWWEHNIQEDLQEVWWRSWTGLICFRIGKVGGLLLMR